MGAGAGVIRAAWRGTTARRRTRPSTRSRPARHEGTAYLRSMQESYHDPNRALLPVTAALGPTMGVNVPGPTRVVAHVTFLYQALSMSMGIDGDKAVVPNRAAAQRRDSSCPNLDAGQGI